ncbi:MULTISPECIES: hypothetical protein [Sorangium]|uniref:Uncharacterized protein n=1 Tax=Sorangium cellulosum TaxID=56 RepID=A0A4V0NFG9_SORCE|nr:MULTISPECIES: hypothetical protein [Sorangium]AUX29632.1 uncharacterized protein SOCE836_017230 [Sorangium cellulosum]WCQ89021.1 hypothetical protein NQZ70_01706 [Sorangium sp. Soce836]
MTDPSERHPVRVIPVDDDRLAVERRDHGSCIRLVDRPCAEPLRIELRPDGPAPLPGSGLSITVAGAGDLQLAAERVAIHAREGIELRSGGATALRSEGDRVSEARAQRLGARRGDVRVEANDRVKRLGERIRLTC